MNQNIVRCTQHRTRQAEGKMDLQPYLNRAVQLKTNAAGRDIPGDGGNLTLAGGQNYRQRKRKTHRATHFLPVRGLVGMHGQRR